MPYNSKELAFANDANTGASASPFVVAIVESGIRVLPDIINVCILIFVLSASNSDIYISSRTLYSLAKRNDMFSIFAYTNRRGVPVYSLAVSGLLACLAFLNAANDSKVVFGYLINLTTVFGTLTWISILVAHIFFVRARRAQGIAQHQLPYKSPAGLVGTYIALAGCIILTLFKNFNVFVYSSKRTYDPSFDYKNFITGYLGIPLYLTMIFGYKFTKRTECLKPTSVDLYSGKVTLNHVEWEDVEHNDEVEKDAIGHSLYARYIAWLF